MRSTFKLSLFLCIVLIVCGLLPTSGCTNSQIGPIVTKIAAFIPSIESANSAVAAVVSAIDPAIAVPVAGVTTVVNTALAEVKVLCANYAANPSASIWQSIVATWDGLLVNGDGALLQAAQIKDANSKNLVTIAIGSLDALLHVVDGWIAGTQTKAQVQARVSQRQVKLDAVVRYWSAQDKAIVAQQLGTDWNTAYREATAAGF
jgi:hypothetical protein